MSPSSSAGGHLGLGGLGSVGGGGVPAPPPGLGGVGESRLPRIFSPLCLELAHIFQIFTCDVAFRSMVCNSMLSLLFCQTVANHNWVIVKKGVSRMIMEQLLLKVCAMFHCYVLL